MEIIREDRRQDRRYDIQLKLRYKVLKGGHVLDEGSGATRNMSRGGVLFESERILAEGMDVELSIEWPIRLRGRYPLELHVMGYVVHADRRQISMRTTWHEFSVATDAEESVTENQLEFVM